MPTTPVGSTQWRREDRTRALLERKGFTVIRCGGPRETPIHLVAVNSNEMILIHVDANGVSAPRDLIEKIVVPESCRKEIWTWPARKRKPNVQTVI